MHKRILHGYMYKGRVLSRIAIWRGGGGGGGKMCKGENAKARGVWGHARQRNYVI